MLADEESPELRRPCFVRDGGLRAAFVTGDGSGESDALPLLGLDCTKNLRFLLGELALSLFAVMGDIATRRPVIFIFDDEFSSSSASTSSFNTGGISRDGKIEALMLPPKLPTLLGAGVGSTRRISTPLATGVSGTEMVGTRVCGRAFLASSTQSLKLPSPFSTNNCKAPPNVRRSTRVK